jgi:hypothetical protein
MPSDAGPDEDKGHTTMREVKEAYRRIGDDDGRLDIEFWQSQGDQAIFLAALDMVLDYLTIRDGHADEPRLQRTIEYFGKYCGPGLGR